MKTWLWFAVAPVALIAAHSAAPPLEERLTAPGSMTAVQVTPFSLPAGVDQVPPRAVQSERPIRLAAFGILAPSEAKVLTRSKGISDVFALQSVLMVGDEAIAVIDGNQVRKGDRLAGGYSVASIETDAVHLTGPAVKGRKRASRVLHFPEYRDVEPVRFAPKVVKQSSAPAGSKTDTMDMEKNYKQILEMLKL